MLFAFFVLSIFIFAEGLSFESLFRASDRFFVVEQSWSGPIGSASEGLAPIAPGHEMQRLASNGSGSVAHFIWAAGSLDLAPILPLPAGQVRAGAPLRAGLLCQNQAITTMQSAVMIIKTFIILLSL